MNTTYTHITMIIDRSGSMSASWTDVMGGYTQIVKDNKSQPGKCTFTVAAFDTEYEMVEDFTDIQNVKEELTVRPRGGTALLDAIGKTIVSVGEQLAKLPEEERPHRVMIYILSDGQENSSREFKKADIENMIKDHESKYSWVFNYVGATLESVKDAVSFGIRSSNSAVYNAENSGNTFSILGEKMLKMRSVSDDEYAATCAWTSEEKESLNS